MRLVAESRTHHDSKWAAITAVAAKWGVATAETVRKGVRQVEIDAGVRAGVEQSRVGPPRR